MLKYVEEDRSARKFEASTRHSVATLITLASALINKRKLSAIQVCIVGLVQDLLDYADGKTQEVAGAALNADDLLLRSVNAYRKFVALYLRKLPAKEVEAMVPFVLKPEPTEPVPVLIAKPIQRCEECDAPLDDDGECWRCNYDRLESLKSDVSDRYESTIRRLGMDKGDLENKLDYTERDLHRSQDKVNELERKLRDAEYRASQSSSSYSRW